MSLHGVKPEDRDIIFMLFSRLFGFQNGHLVLA